MVFSSSEEEHVKHVASVLQRLRDNNLFAKASKCVFHASSVEYLGYVVSSEGLKMDSSKVQQIFTWPQPKNIKALQSFLGFANFYCHFIKNYSKRITALTSLLKRDSPLSSMRKLLQCSKNKNIHHKKLGLLKPLQIPAGPWNSLSMDFITQLRLSNSFDSILVVVDRFSKMGIFIPTYGKITALELAQIFISHVFSKHGLPMSIVSDRGSLFVSPFWTNLFQQLKISRDLSTAFHPETDGQKGRVNLILEHYFWMYVWVASKNIKTTRPTKKLSEIWLGPFEVIEKIGSHAYHLKLPQQWKSVHPVFHVSLLEPVKKSIIPNRHQLPPPPVLVEEQEEWEVAQ
ncbi:hypothetical protein O181_113185, partial [Austropuccinia psidii MF-1]|nr:hypothetical protein [Austropuccinia psidii MF-1]